MLLEGPISPMLATPGRALPAGDGWILEPKWDGWRALAHAATTAATRRDDPAMAAVAVAIDRVLNVSGIPDPMPLPRIVDEAIA